MSAVTVSSGGAGAGDEGPAAIPETGPLAVGGVPAAGPGAGEDGTGLKTGWGVSPERQQAIADTFFDLRLIPKKLNLLHAAPVDLLASR